MYTIPTATDEQILSLLAGYPVDLSVIEAEDAEISEVCGPEPMRPLPDFWDICFAEEAHEVAVQIIMESV